jgi:2,4-dienoyl-CoA reductase (NADPH2)
MEAQLQKSGAKVMLNTEADEATVAAGKPDAIIVAAGARPIVPGIPGVKGDNVVTALDVLSGKKQVGDRVVIVGGGQVGCETAEHLAEKGHQVTVLEMLERIGNDIGLTTRWVIMQRMRQAGIATETGTRVVEITGEGVKAERNGAVDLFPADSVVLAAGLTPRDELAQRLKGKAAEVHSIGDCAEVQKIANAIEAGFRIAIEI